MYFCFKAILYSTGTLFQLLDSEGNNYVPLKSYTSKFILRLQIFQIAYICENPLIKDIFARVHCQIF